MDISFIIPAHNEEECIGPTLFSIKQNVPAHITYEMIVIDNGSSDNTVEIAQQYGAHVYLKKDTTIAGLRNYGFKKSIGRIIIFIDADITLTEKWKDNIYRALQSAQKQKIITGSICTPPESKNWLLNHWFSSISQKKSNSYLGSAHMIMSRDLFLEANGFDEKLTTGEDHDICQRIRKLGGNIIINPELGVIHQGFPLKVSEFIKRERWHGLGDAQSFAAILRSKIVLASIIFMTLHIILFLCPFYFGLSGFISSLLFLILFLVISSLIKFGFESTKGLFIKSAIFYLYYLGRSLSLLQIFAKIRHAPITSPRNNKSTDRS